MVMEQTVRKTEYTEVLKRVKPGAGGASRQYDVMRTEGCGPEDCLSQVYFQEGPIPSHGINGIQMEDLIAICIDRLTDFQAGPFACEPNQVALDHLKQALNALDARTAERRTRGVEGKLEK